MKCLRMGKTTGYVPTALTPESPKIISVMTVKNKGFSLLEVIIAVAILSSGIMVVLQAFSFCAHLTGLFCDITNAVFLAEDKLQELEFNLGKQNITDLLKAGIARDKFNWSWDIAPYPESNLLHRVNFNITWHRLNNRENINITTYLLNLNQSP